MDEELFYHSVTIEISILLYESKILSASGIGSNENIVSFFGSGSDLRRS